ncbi:hypothetical protein GH714_011057 [Hevea brasiliensis]|uniref:Uncharacterized protein n=1 Tax=Hevea brasiliensis TaxID=3981 RepID=A0A6A6L9C9_HEVBR|nr:hypothetical protein GH714_011057 [Hevea brasiliensis]
MRSKGDGSGNETEEDDIVQVKVNMIGGDEEDGYDYHVESKGGDLSMVEDTYKNDVSKMWANYEDNKDDMGREIRQHEADKGLM